ncbi:TPA: GNAT family N-acetyltransferase [Campylobacter lari]|uniref:GNAT family N-acetyltransferase n=1 Tax=Campylobacter TaxID=194 RepID=UPI000E1212F9|nr:GNAT family N-acetyltransferase [Campylobacter lari]MCR8682621.1 GNAT family N-acetyltransferase [Campylobacter sp. LMG 17559]EGH4467961.1 GNAT family N-acetyltransferase [Campylobacter lari]MBT0819904.1 GNAT family N-acetyltransferase [Campylobacter lari]MCR6558445.1 GNAT family N-acetyltransferase [Campylobacter lari]MCV3345653.1 GNAT family N-acetyltransferase [Campylobacter lari]
MLETNRLIIRKFTIEDTEHLFSILSDEEVNKYLPWFPFTSIEQTKKHLDEFYIRTNNQNNFYRYAVCLKENNIPIGYIHFENNNTSNDFGYGLKKEYWSKGIITEACKKVIEKLKNDNIKYITATHDISNIASGKVMKKLSMTYKYSYEELWQPKNIKVIFRMYQLNLDGNNDRVYKEYWNKYSNHFIEFNTSSIP